MILKQKDDITPQLKALEALRGRADLTQSQRKEIDEELWTLKAGARGEKEAAYHLDFLFGDLKWTAVIHDLRIEHKGRVAQIDHLILNRLMEVHVLESKNFSGEVQVSADGEWEIETRYGWRGMLSPIEQNRRHIEVLKAYIRDNDLAPRRAGFLSLKPDFHNWVLVSPRCQLKKCSEGYQNVVKMDMFVRRFEKQIDEGPSLSDLVSIAKVVGTDTLFAFADSLVAGHRPARFDYPARFSLAEPALVNNIAPVVRATEATKASSSKECQGCGAALEPKVIAFCRYNSRRFGKTPSLSQLPDFDDSGLALRLQTAKYVKSKAVEPAPHP